eukprot:CAMPEP_0196761144 /NCGR_PEP_ID=MMETSP1095-20130614/281_1 /TAXON_ID=96789 ORGANISM="Chromulina nebulosa, Strain UTEXLB2642" /NCGR_SAMPLE_ID=MMETSP1095 /ASSEMBLY_ACC=CAM_ASM_000446 /LENGTH=194 /DNA_ID=CAMNT_0042110297 /DNA_START=39 /DNA_END=623 /DNA_ORIENTATION=-
MAGRNDGETTKEWLERLISSGASDARILAVTEILKNESSLGTAGVATGKIGVTTGSAIVQYAYETRKYSLTSLNLPDLMLTYGVRDYFVKRLRGCSLCGIIRRAWSADFDQHLSLTLHGTSEELSKFENEFLTPNEDSGHWKWNITERSLIRSLPVRSFSVVKSTFGAISGPNSDPKDDYKSTHSGSSSKSIKK